MEPPAVSASFPKAERGELIRRSISGRFSLISLIIISGRFFLIWGLNIISGRFGHGGRFVRPTPDQGHYRASRGKPASQGRSTGFGKNNQMAIA